MSCDVAVSAAILFASMSPAAAAPVKPTPPPVAAALAEAKAPFVWDESMGID